MLQRCSPFRGQRLAPGVTPLFVAAPGRVLPLGLGRQPLPRPFAVCERVVVGDVDHWMSHAGLDARPRPLRAPPVGPPDGPPPGGGVHRSPHLLLRSGREEPVEHERPAEPLGLRLVARLLYERRELGVRGRVRGDVEGIERDPAHRSLTVPREPLAVVGAHQEGCHREAGSCPPQKPLPSPALPVVVRKTPRKPASLARNRTGRSSPATFVLLLSLSLSPCSSAVRYLHCSTRSTDYQPWGCRVATRLSVGVIRERPLPLGCIDILMYFENLFNILERRLRGRRMSERGFPC